MADQLQPESAESNVLQGYLAAGVTIVVWASAFAGIRFGLESYSPEAMALLRYIVASAVLIVYALITRMPLPDWRDLPQLALMGFLGFTLYNLGLNAGEVTVSAGVASLLIASESVIIALIAVFFMKEKLSLLGWVGIFLSFIGVAVISLIGEDGLYLDPGAILILIAAIGNAFYITGQKAMLKKYGARAFVTYALWLGTLFMLIFLPQLLNEIPDVTPEATLAVIYMGIFPGVIGYIAWSFALSRLPVSIAGSLLYLIPAISMLIAWIWLGEVPGISALLGGTMIIAGVLLVHKKGNVPVL
ncbi:DMT family transporter [Anaerolineales bacterium]